MEETRILIVDDDEDVLQILSLFLKAEGFAISCLKDGNSVLQVMEEFRPDLVILDVLLAKLNGVEICQDIRNFSQVPIVFISCKSEDTDKVMGFNAGGDDYVTKPFSPIELVARVKAHLRRKKQYVTVDSQEDEQLITLRELEVHLLNQTLHINGKEVTLTAKEFKILSIMIKHPNRLYSLDELYELVWGEGSHNDTRTVMVHISNLRKKIEKNPSAPEYIHTVKGLGYKLVSK